MPFTDKDTKIWFKAIEEGDADVVQAYIDAGFDAASVSSHGYNGIGFLTITVQQWQKDTYDAIMPLLIEALFEQYAHDPEALLDALEHKAGGDTQKPLERISSKNDDGRLDSQVKILEDAVRAAKIARVRHVSGKAPPAKKEEAGPAVRSESPPPLKADKTLTLTRLLDTKPDGRTNLQIFAEQGQLADVFAPHIWQGRREEMEKAWDQVPEEHRAQVNIEGTRAHLDAYDIRERFRPQTGDDLSQGF